MEPDVYEIVGFGICWNEELMKCLPTGAPQNELKVMAKIREVMAD